MRRGRPPYPDVLTPREWEVLALLRSGLTNDEIAERLSISSRTAKYHVSEIIGKLGVEDRQSAARWQPDLQPERRGLFAPVAWFLRKMPGVSSSGAAPAPVVLGSVAVLTASFAGLALLAVLFFRANASEPVGAEPALAALAPTDTNAPAGGAGQERDPVGIATANGEGSTPLASAQAPQTLGETPVVPGQPTPTPTPLTPPAVCGAGCSPPTPSVNEPRVEVATPTSPVAAAVPTPCSGAGCLNFAIGVDVDGDGTNDCGTGVPSAVGDGAPDAVAIEVTNTSCVADEDAQLDVRVYLIDNGGIAYAGQAAHVYYAGLISNRRGTTHWACHLLDANAFAPAFENTGSAVAFAPPCNVAQANLGLMNSFSFTCAQGGTIVLGHALGETNLTGDDLEMHNDPGSDAVAVTCGSRTPAPTMTPSPTRAPTPTPSSPMPCVGGTCTSPQFAVGIDADDNGTNDCGSGVPLAVGDGAPDVVTVLVTNTNCRAIEGAALQINVYLIDSDGIAYVGAAAHVLYSGLMSNGRGTSVWTCHTWDVAAPANAAYENVGSTVGPTPPCNVAQRNLGLMSRFSFTCAQDGVITLGHAQGQTGLFDASNAERRDHGTDALSVTCGSDASPATVGDSNCDGSTNSTDATMILQLDAGLVTGLPCRSVADVNSDGALDARDAALILQYNAGLVAGLG